MVKFKDMMNRLTTVDLGPPEPQPINPEVKVKTTEPVGDMCSYCRETFTGDRVAERRAVHIKTAHKGKPTH